MHSSPALRKNKKFQSLSDCKLMLDLSHLDSYLGQGLTRWNLLYFGQHNIIYRYSINVPCVIVVYSSAYYVFVCRIYSQGRYGSYIYCSQQDAKDVLEIENTSPDLHLTQVCITKQQSTSKHSFFSLYIFFFIYDSILQHVWQNLIS